MKNKILVFALLTVGFSLASFAYVSAETPLQPAECTDFYKSNSVKVDISPELTQTLGGSQMRFYLNIVNDNDYPVVDGSVWVRIFKKQDSAQKAQEFGHILVDQFVAKENINLDVKRGTEADFLWDVPAWATSGEYMAYAYFYSGDKFNFIGVPFVEDIGLGQTNFKVSSEIAQMVGLDNSKTKVNGQLFSLDTKNLRFSKDEVIKVEVTIKNNSTEQQEAEITYELYGWDAVSEANSISTKKELVTLKAKESRVLTYEIEDTGHAVYYLVTKSKWNNSQSMTEIRVYRDGVASSRFSFQGLNKFPVKQGESVRILSCAQLIGSQSLGGKVELSLMDETGTQIENFTYGSAWNGNLVGLTADFMAPKNYNVLTLKGVITDGQNNVLDMVELKYDCKNTDASKCLIEEGEEKSSGIGNISMWAIVAFIVILVLGLTIAIFSLIRKRHRNIINSNGDQGQNYNDMNNSQGGGISGGMMMLLVLALTVGFIASGQIAEARTVTYSYSLTESLSDGISHHLGSSWKVLTSPQYYFTFNAQAVNTTNNASLENPGASIAVGSKVRFSYNPADFSGKNSNVYWSGTRYTSGPFCGFPMLNAPRGYWTADANHPFFSSFAPGVERGGFCDSESRALTAAPVSCTDVDPEVEICPVSELSYDGYYLPLSVNPPTITIDVSASDAGVLTNCVDSAGGSVKTCDVSEVGTIRSRVKFESSFAYQYIEQLIHKGPGGNCNLDQLFCTGMSQVQRCTDFGGVNDFECTGSESDLRIDVPVQTIAFDVAAVAAVTPPADEEDSIVPAPVVTGPTAGNPGIQYTFSARSEAFQFEADGVTPTSERVRYGFDWNNDAIVDFWTSWVQQGQPNSASFTWVSLGAKTFRVKTQDFDRDESGWGYHTINISNNGSAVCTEGDIWTACSATCGGGTQSLIHVDAGCATSIIKTEKCNIQACGTVIIEVPPGG